jgi:hypothetical protein
MLPSEVISPKTGWTLASFQLESVDLTCKIVSLSTLAELDNDDDMGQLGITDTCHLPAELLPMRQ